MKPWIFSALFFCIPVFATPPNETPASGNICFNFNGSWVCPSSAGGGSGGGVGSSGTCGSATGTGTGLGGSAGGGSGGGGSAGPFHTDYSVMNSSMGDVRSILGGGSSDAICNAAQNRMAAIQNSLAATQAAVAQLTLQNQQAIHACLPAAQRLPGAAELIHRASQNRPGVVDLSQIPTPSEASLPYRFQSAEGTFRDQVVDQFQNLYKVSSQAAKRQMAREIGLTSTKQADQAYAQGRFEDAQFHQDLGRSMLDISIGKDPSSGMGRSAFELLTGRNLMTGRILESAALQPERAAFEELRTALQNGSQEYPHSNFWNREITFEGNRVFQRNDLIDPTRLNPRTQRTSLEMMREGYTPTGPDGQPIQLHHLTQQEQGTIGEVTTTFHAENSRIIHINQPASEFPSGINRQQFNRWRRQYWINRARDFQ